MDTKMAVAFANIFMVKVETEILNLALENRLSGNDSMTSSTSLNCVISSLVGTQPEKRLYSSV